MANVNIQVQKFFFHEKKKKPFYLAVGKALLIYLFLQDAAFMILKCELYAYTHV